MDVLDEHKIEEYLNKQGITSMEASGHKRIVSLLIVTVMTNFLFDYRKMCFAYKPSQYGIWLFKFS